uniref:Endonuclease/exonuclease/phosphatase domain-containing protein n=1 Tax=Myripristis murdjan TaxID=586833 RepID=A0A667XQ36_9TELE
MFLYIYIYIYYLFTYFFSIPFSIDCILLCYLLVFSSSVFLMGALHTGRIILFAGDFNQVFTEQDSSSRKRKPNVPRELLDFLSLNDLTDVWRLMHPKDKDYTYSSYAQDSYSRLDYIFVSKAGVEDVTTSKIQDIVISDHAAVTCTMCPPTNKV